MSDSPQRKSKATILAIVVLLLFPVWGVIPIVTRNRMGCYPESVLEEILWSQADFKKRHKRYSISIVELDEGSALLQESIADEPRYAFSMEVTDSGFIARSVPKVGDGKGRKVCSLDQSGNIQVRRLPLSWSHWIKVKSKAVWKVSKGIFLIAWPLAALASLIYLVIIGKRKIFGHLSAHDLPKPAP